MKIVHLIGILAVLLLVAGCAKEVVEVEPTVTEPVKTPEEIAAEEAAEEAAREEAAKAAGTILLGQRAAEPTDITIKAGGEVTFQAEESNTVKHIMRLYKAGTMEEIARTGSIGPGETGSLVIDEPGVYDFRAFPTATLTGTITVE